MTSSAKEGDYTGPDTMKVLTSDGKEIDLDMKFMDSCQTLRAQAETLEEGAAATPIPVSSASLAVVEKFCKYHAEHPGEYSVYNPLGIINSFKQFDKSFSDELRENVDLLFETMAATDYLNEPNLLDVLCRTAALLIKGKPHEEVRKVLRVDVVSADEHKENMKKHPFASKY